MWAHVDPQYLLLQYQQAVTALMHAVAHLPFTTEKGQQDTQRCEAYKQVTLRVNTKLLLVNTHNFT